MGWDPVIGRMALSAIGVGRRIIADRSMIEERLFIGLVVAHTAFSGCAGKNADPVSIGVVTLVTSGRSMSPKQRKV